MIVKEIVQLMLRIYFLIHLILILISLKFISGFYNYLNLSIYYKVVHPKWLKLRFIKNLSKILILLKK